MSKELEAIDVAIKEGTRMVREMCGTFDQERIEEVLERLCDAGMPVIGAAYHLGMMMVARARQVDAERLTSLPIRFIDPRIQFPKSGEPDDE